MGEPQNRWFIGDNPMKMDDDWGYKFGQAPTSEWSGSLYTVCNNASWGRPVHINDLDR